jgi:hypothetical protein
MTEGRVMLRAEQQGRSFAWLISPELAERLVDELRERGWTVTIHPDSHYPHPEQPSPED